MVTIKVSQIIGDNIQYSQRKGFIWTDTWTELDLKDTDSNPVPKIHKSLQSHLNQRVEELEAEIEQAKAESEKYRQKFKGVIYYIYYILF